MDNFYEILGISNTADLAQIKSAYKKLAKEYHPDRNPQVPDAEEKFKQINEAYHTLSDPLKKLNYDARTTLLPLYAQVHYERQEELKWRHYWYWKKNQDKPYYKLDKEYFKIQALAFLVFIVISGFCFALVHTADYIMEQKHLARWRANSLSLKKVNGLFGQGQYDDAFQLIHFLSQNDPREFRFFYAKDSLVNELRIMADQHFDARDFAGAVSYYLKLQEHEQPGRYETLRRISLCQYYLGNWKESLQALKHLHNQQPRNLELVYQIGLVNLEKLENTKEALHYFTLGKKLFKQNLSQVYGAAFEVILDPADVPDIYFEIFEARARCNLALKNYQEAVTDCNWAIFLRPMKGIPYKLRSEAYAELDRPDKVCQDIHEAGLRGVATDNVLKRRFCR